MSCHSPSSKAQPTPQPQDVSSSSLSRQGFEALDFLLLCRLSLNTPQLSIDGNRRVLGAKSTCAASIIKIDDGNWAYGFSPPSVFVRADSFGTPDPDRRSTATRAPPGLRKGECCENTVGDIDMSALFNFHSFLTVVLLVICTCTYVKMHFPAILEQRTGFRGFFWKAARIGERLSPWMAIGCFSMGVSIIFF